LKRKVIIHHLEMTDRADFRPAAVKREGLEVRQSHIPCPELNRFFYAAVGEAWSWVDRLIWTDEHWLDYLDRPELATWIGYFKGTPAGYFELEAQPESSVEIVYFGLLPQFVGIGIGGQFLNEAIERAWEMGGSRVWLHTCSLDHPAALANYEARGFKVFKEEVTYQT
jgi:GNAT superfamily N-acetyltransferase